MNQTKHTPLPWRQDEEHPGKIHGADGYEVLDAFGLHLHADYDSSQGHWAAIPDSHRERTEEEEEANAKLIVRAVNSHADLVEGCRLGLAYMEERGIYDTADRARPLRAAIAKAEGRPGDQRINVGHPEVP